jgi:poly-gamma-glutamate synthesis protein (capsule biosynthesis protein)
VSGERLLEPVGPVRLSLAAIGDVGVIGSARARAAREGWDAVFAAVAPALRAADLGFANLEMPVAEAGQVRPGRSPEFRHDAQVLPALARAGVRVLALANNHIMDCGPRGLEHTLSA